MSSSLKLQISAESMKLYKDMNNVNNNGHERGDTLCNLTFFLQPGVIS